MAVKIKNFDNGFRAVSDEMKDVETVTISVGTYIGSVNESSDQNGISHFLEHMAFKGTQKRTYLDIAREIEDIGGYMNAFTSKEKTVYYVKVLKEHLETGISLLSDILQNSTFPEGEIEKERGVILQELAASLDTPDDIIYDYFMQTAFPEQSMGRMILGSAENIKSFKRDDFNHYIKTKYNAGNMVISAAGNIKHEDLVSLSEKYFTNLKPANKIEQEKADYKGGEYNVQNSNLSQVQFTIGFKSVSYHDENRFKLDVLSDIMLGGMSSRLFQEVREKLGLVYTISDCSSTYKDAGMFAIYAGTSPQNLELLTKTICTELKKAIHDISQEEVNKTITKIKAHRLMSLESTTSRAQTALFNQLIYNRDVPFDETLNNYTKLTAEDIRSFVADIVNGKELTLSTYGDVKLMPSIVKVKDMLS
jgi:predicted Zn-dependent peptidase